MSRNRSLMRATFIILEAMIFWRSCLQSKQYIEIKHHKHGIKLYMLIELNGMILKFHVYEISSDIYSVRGHTENVVLHLLEEKLGNGDAAHLDNSYNSVQLATNLLQEITYCSGTLRSDGKTNSKEVRTGKCGENKSIYCNGILAGEWQDKCKVLYIPSEYL